MNNNDIDLVKRAASLSIEERSRFLTQIPETEMHKHLVRLFVKAEENVSAEITHGVNEFGRDIVLRRTDPYGDQFVGVVVKRNPYKNLTGRSAGPIDEVISQANQAIKHPCQLKEISDDKVDISTVMIVFVSRLSDNAMRRLAKETEEIHGRRIVLLNQLVNLFTEHYPEVFFDGRVTEYLTDKIIELESSEEIFNRIDNLSAWFVNPMVSVVDGGMDISDKDLMTMVGDKNVPFVSLIDYVKPNSHLLLTGDPGSGKSTALRKLALDMLRTAQQQTLASVSKKHSRKLPRQIP